MTIIELYDHPFAPVAAKVFEVESLAEWLLTRYGASPNVSVQIFAGDPSGETEITGDVRAVMDGAAPRYVVLESPGGPYLYIVQIILVVFAVASALLASKPSMPSNVNRTQASPNNSLGDRSNQVRYLQRVEDIYGTVLAIPSLMMPTYNKYIDNKQYEYGYYCVGRGYYDITDVKDADTLISDITGAAASFYLPFTSPNSGDAPFLQIGDPINDDVLTVARSSQVDGITLPAFNQTDVAPGQIYAFVVQPGPTTKITQTSTNPNFNAVFDTSSQASVSFDRLGEHYEGIYDVIEVGDAYIIVNGVASDGGNIASQEAEIERVGSTANTDWVTLPATDRTQVWVNILAANGMYRDSGGGKTLTSVGYAVDYERLTQALVPTGQVETITGTMTGQTSDEVAVTAEHTTSWAGPVRVRMRRTSPYDYAFSGTIVDEIKWRDLYAVSPVDRVEFGNKTTLHTVTEATARATAIQSRQLNCIAARRLPTYNGSTFSGAFDADGRIVSGTITATARLVDIIAAVSVDPEIGRRNLATDVDINQIYAVQGQLDAWNPLCGRFNYTLDSDNISYEETLTLIANAGFCIAYRQNSKIRLAADLPQPTSVALFTHRNKAIDSETITRTFANDSDYDGVEFVYTDPDTLQSETISLPLDGTAENPKKFEIAGIRSFTQAWLRANREYFKLRGQRVTISTQTTNDARALLPNSRIDIVDNTRFKSYDGEVVGQAGLELTLSRAVAFTTGASHSIVLMRRDGTLQAINVTPGSEARKVVLAALPSEAIVTVGGAAGIRTIFSFASDSARAAQAYLVQTIDLSGDTYPTVTAVNYSDAYYQADYATIPDKEPIIN